MASRSTRSSRAKLGEQPTHSLPAQQDHGENNASTIVEAPLPKHRDPLVAHDFADGGGSGGAESFSRKRLKP